MTPSPLRSAATVIGPIQEGVRRRVFLAVLVLTVGFLALYALGAHFAFQDADEFAGGERRSSIRRPSPGRRSSAWRCSRPSSSAPSSPSSSPSAWSAATPRPGLLQPLVVRPIGRTTMLLARFAGAAMLSAAYVIVVYLRRLGDHRATGHWSPDHLLGPALALALGVAIIAALSLLASTLLSVTAQGIVVFMVFGAGLTAGLLAQIGHAINSDSLHTIGRVASWALPFEGLYAAGLHALISEHLGTDRRRPAARPVRRLRGRRPGLIVWAFVYMAGRARAGRRDLRPARPLTPGRSEVERLVLGPLATMSHPKSWNPR